MNEIISKFKDEMSEFKNVCEAYYNGNLSMAEYKAKSGGFGTYSERGHKTGMIRLRIPAGDMTNEQFGFICTQIKKYDVERIHFTTNQSIQLHGLDCTAICSIMQEALNYGIITRGSGGDFPRNAMSSPLSGVQKGEAFDVLPYSKTVSDYVMQFIGKVKLPRKLKIGFSNTPENIVHSTYRDMGFVARPDGKFDLYTAGGLGINPAMGIKTAESIEKKDVLYYVKAMIQMFVTYGNYESRAKARTRFIPRTIGEDKYLEEFQKIVKELKTKEDLAVEPYEFSVQKQGDESKPTKNSIYNRNITEQKQEGLYAVKYHPASGCPKPEILCALYEAISKMKNVTMRLSTKEEAYIINLTGSEADKILDITKDDTAKTNLQESVTCIGASVCQVGIADSRALLAAILEVEKEENFSDGTLPKIFISGCPSSCAAHQTGVIGFQGCKKKVNDETVTAFQMFVGGSEIQNKEKFGEAIGVIPKNNIPEMFRELGREVESYKLSFENWFETNKDRLFEIAQKYFV